MRWVAAWPTCPWFGADDGPRIQPDHPRTRPGELRHADRGGGRELPARAAGGVGLPLRRGPGRSAGLDGGLLHQRQRRLRQRPGGRQLHGPLPRLLPGHRRLRDPGRHPIRRRPAQASGRVLWPDHVRDAGHDAARVLARADHRLPVAGADVVQPLHPGGLQQAQPVLQRGLAEVPAAGRVLVGAVPVRAQHPLRRHRHDDLQRHRARRHRGGPQHRAAARQLQRRHDRPRPAHPGRRPPRDHRLAGADSSPGWASRCRPCPSTSGRPTPTRARRCP